MHTLPFVIYVDVDNTFIRSSGTKRIPMPGVIKHIRQLKLDGAQLYCWGSGGGDYAQASAREVGIEDCFIAFLPKPHLMIDDQEFHAWRRLRYVHPMECQSKSLAEYRVTADVMHVK